MKIPFNPAVIYSFLPSRALHKNTSWRLSSLILPIIWIMSSSLFLHFPYALPLNLLHSTSEFTAYYTVWTVWKQTWCLIQLYKSHMVLVHSDILHSFIDLNWTVNSAGPQCYSIWFPISSLPWHLPQLRITGVVLGESALVYQDWNEWEGWEVKGNLRYEMSAACIWL